MKNNVSVNDEVLVALRRIIRSIDLHSRYLARNFGLTGPQLMILRELSTRREVSAGEIAKAVSLSQATVTGIIDRLEKGGLINKRRSETDRRRVLISQTRACQEILEKTPPPMQESFLEKFASLEDWEQAMILSSLERLVKMIDASDLDAEPVLATGPIGNTMNGTESNESKNSADE